MLSGLEDSHGTSVTLWVGDLDPWVEESTLIQMFPEFNQHITNVKLIREKGSNSSSGYGFVEFASHDIADQVLKLKNGNPIPINPTKRYRLNWAQFGIDGKRADTGVQYSIFVGDLAPEVSDQVLENHFKLRYLSVIGARCVMDTASGRSKGYGFVRFKDEQECKRALEEMNGTYLLSRAMRISTATPKKSELAASGTTPASPGAPVGVGTGISTITTAGADPSTDSSNTTVFIGNLDPTVTVDLLKTTFQQFGIVTSTKIPAGKGCGFVTYSTRDSAEVAIKSMVGKFIGAQRVRVSWGKAGQKTTQVQTPASLPLATGALLAMPTSPYVSTEAPSAFDYTSYYQQQLGNEAKAHASSHSALLPASAQVPASDPSQAAWGAAYDWSAYYPAQPAAAWDPYAAQPMAGTDPATGAYGYNYWGAYSTAQSGAYFGAQQPAQSQATVEEKAPETNMVEVLRAEHVHQKNKEYIEKRRREFLTLLVGTTFLPSGTSTVSTLEFAQK